MPTRSLDPGEKNTPTLRVWERPSLPGAESRCQGCGRTRQMTDASLCSVPLPTGLENCLLMGSFERNSCVSNLNIKIAGSVRLRSLACTDQNDVVLLVCAEKSCLWRWIGHRESCPAQTIGLFQPGTRRWERAREAYRSRASRKEICFPLAMYN